MIEDFKKQHPRVKVCEFETEIFNSKIGPIEISADRTPGPVSKLTGRSSVSPFRRMRNVAQAIVDRDIYCLESINFIPKVFVDIGSGPSGSVALKAHYLWPDCKVFSVEPNVNLNYLNNLLGKKNIYVEPSPVAGFYGNKACDLYFPREMNARERRLNNPLNLSVQTFLTKYNIDKIDVLKIDCEACEVGILTEMEHLGILQDIKVITGEWHWEFSRFHVNELLKDTHNIKWKWRDGGHPTEWRSFSEWTPKGSSPNWDEFYAELK